MIGDLVLRSKVDITSITVSPCNPPKVFAHWLVSSSKEYGGTPWVPGLPVQHPRGWDLRTSKNLSISFTLESISCGICSHSKMELFNRIQGTSQRAVKETKNPSSCGLDMWHVSLIWKWLWPVHQNTNNYRRNLLQCWQPVSHFVFHYQHKTWWLQPNPF